LKYQSGARYTDPFFISICASCTSPVYPGRTFCAKRSYFAYKQRRVDTFSE
jgi:hypothetical protein